MKTSKTFSIEIGLVNNFNKTCAENTLNCNAVISKLIKEFIGEMNLDNIKMKTCGVCEAIYSGNLPECPECKLKKRIEDKQQLLEELKIKKVKMEKWLKEGKAQQNEMDIIDIEIKALEEDLK